MADEILPPFRTFTSGERRAELGERWQQQKPSSVSGVATSTLTGATKQELYEKAKEADIPGRSKMTKDELAQALAAKR